MSQIALAQLTSLADDFAVLLASCNSRQDVMQMFLLLVLARVAEIDADADEMIDRFDPPYA